MKKFFIAFILVVSLSIPTAASGLSLSETSIEPPYTYYRGILVVGPEYMPMEMIPYTLLIGGVEYFIDVDNPNVLPLIWGLREGIYEVTAVAYLATEVGYFPDVTIECDVAHVIKFIFE